jgi:ubiquitin-like 1-activating enzyme E1 B
VIKQAIGTTEFASLVFEKVFNMDIQRLLSMSDMWKSRIAPKPLKYSDFTAIGLNDTVAHIVKDDQPIWNLETNVAVFKYRSSSVPIPN